MKFNHEKKEKTMSEPKIAGTTPIAMRLDPGEYHWCACGLSARQPFCDGSHEGSEFTPLVFKLDKKQEVYLCACKRTGNAPFCDGAHKSL